MYKCSVFQGIRKKRSKRDSDAADEDDEEDEEDDDSDRMTPRLPKRERRESESVTQRSSFAANFSPTPAFSESVQSGLPPERSKDTPASRTDYGSLSPMSPSLTPAMPASSSVFGIERKPFDFMSPHSNTGDIIPSFGGYSSASAKPPPGYPGIPRPVREAASHLLHQTSGQQPVYSPGNKPVYSPGTGSQYSGSKFHYSGDGGSQPPGLSQPQHFYSGSGQFLPPSKSTGHGSGHVAPHRRPSVIMRAGKEDSSKLQMQADILKFHGNILTHTGK